MSEHKSKHTSYCRKVLLNAIVIEYECQSNPSHITGSAYVRYLSETLESLIKLSESKLYSHSPSIKKSIDFIETSIKYGFHAQ